MARKEESGGKKRFRLGGWKTSRGIRILLFLLLAGLFYVSLAGHLIPETYDILPNTVSEKTIRSPKQIVNEIETQKAKDEAAERVEPVYTTITLRTDQLIDRLYSYIQDNNTDATLAFEIKVNIYRDRFANEMSEFVNSTVQSLIRSGLYDDDFAQEVGSKLKDQQYRVPEDLYYRIPRLTEEDLLAMAPVTKQIVSRIMNDQIVDAAEARAKVAELVNATNLDKTQRETLQEIARYAILPNTFYNAKATDEARAKARETTPPVYINKGDVVVEKGQLITDDIYAKLEQLGLLQDEVHYWPQMGLLLLSAMIVVVVFLDMERANARSKTPTGVNNMQLVMLGVILAISLLALKIVSVGNSLNYPYIGFLAPVSMGTMLVSILLNDRLALLTGVIMSLASSIIFNNDPNTLFDFRYGLLGIVMCYAAIYTIHKASQRSTILKAGTIVSLVGVLTVLMIFLLENRFTVRDMLFAIGFALANGVLTGVLVIGLMPFFEAAFGILSPLKLVELSNPNHPLLRKLLTEAPGTYHHSIMVGNLAEAAAEAVGADGLLCRVGSYYHDVGKTKRPSYFIENLQNMENPHDSIDPALSKSIIVAHARDGVELLMEYKVPKPIRDIAEQHHGTTLLKYFYHKAKQLAGDGVEVKEEDYRYPGPKAQSKEAAIVGIADSVEAAVRSLKKPNIEAIDSLVQKIIKDRLDDNQFNECELTLKELDTIAKALKEALLGIFHSRIEYPSDLSKNQETKDDSK